MNKIPGFRTDSPWKMVLATISYSAILGLLLIIMITVGIGSVLFTILNFVLIAAFIISIIALIKGNLLSLYILNRKIAGIILAITILLILVIPIPETETANSSQTASDEVNNTEEKHEDSEKENTSNDNEEKKQNNDIEKQNDQDKDTDQNNEGKKQSDKTSNDSSDKDIENTSNNDNISSNEKKQQASTPGDATATVTRVVDGDTIEIRLNGKTEDVRLLLVDTPETVHPSEPVQPFGPEASQFAKSQLTGKKVQIEYDGPKRDHYGRLLAYLWVDGQNFNKMLLEKGLARYAYVYDPPYTHSNAFMKAQNRAKNAERGIWSRNNYVTSDGFNYQESQQSDNTETASSNDSSPKSTSSNSSSNGLKYDPNGPDRDCGDFDTQQEAQDFYEAAGGPDADPHRLDGSDNDGEVCESLPAA
ncbi:thermonuclease family protein [Virgibacillus doumboii]|uniref:thermonuclease family protein n=1 Tax=Virgibacillus doumboii TaxID=2697503 RepID=UPI001FE3E8F8|nr:thermonuclease family protein [Virgibacillus doumboii]